MDTRTFLKTCALGFVGAFIPAPKPKKPITPLVCKWKTVRVRAYDQKWKHDELYNELMLKMMDRAKLDSTAWVMPIGWPPPKT